jgi:2-C-methyl-D-erythritol 4-phosphate cytidylyltransferase
MSNNDYAIIVAAGKGYRMGSNVPKQYLEMGGRPIVAHTLDVFCASGLFEEVILVIPPGDGEYVREHVLTGCIAKNLVRMVEGGNERQQSVYNGLMTLPGDAGVVIVHDAVRPFLTAGLIEKSLHAARRYGAAVTGMPVKDTIKKVDSSGFVVETPDRRTLWSVQTPQAFRYKLLLEAHRQAAAEGWKATDDAMLIERMGQPVRMIEGSYNNIKITTPEDLILAKQFVSSGEVYRGI